MLSLHFDGWRSLEVFLDTLSKVTQLVRAAFLSSILSCFYHVWNVTISFTLWISKLQLFPRWHFDRIHAGLLCLEEQGGATLVNVRYSWTSPWSHYSLGTAWEVQFLLLLIKICGLSFSTFYRWGVASELKWNVVCHFDFTTGNHAFKYFTFCPLVLLPVIQAHRYTHTHTHIHTHTHTHTLSVKGEN